MKKTNLFKTLVAVATIFVGLTFIQCGGSAVSKQLKMVADAMNAQCPMMVDGNLRLDGVKASGKELIYDFTLTNVSKDDYEGTSFEDMFKVGAVNSMKAQPSFKELSKHNVIFIYNYKDKNGVSFEEMKITPNDYK